MSSKKNSSEKLRKKNKTEKTAAERITRRHFIPKKKKSERPGSISIAFQISIEELVSMGVCGIIADLAYIILMISAVFYNAEMTVNGSFSGFDRSHLIFPEGGSFNEHLRGAVIAVSKADSQTVNVEVGSYLRFLLISVIVIVAVQFVFLVAACVIVPDRTYKRLKPLYNMTEAAQALKNIDITDSESKSGGELEIHTGKEELAGLEDAVNDLLKRARHSYQSQIRFVSDASHELRTPIAVIQGYANMLDRWGREDKAILDESIESIKSEAENMNRLVENLLFLARGDSGRAVIRFEQLDINQLICDIYEEFVMIDKKHEFSLDLRSDIKANADPSLLKQCLRILTDNAVKYSPEGTDIILRLRKLDDKSYAIDVQDHGIGIKSDEIGKIFDRFYRSDPARNRSSGGYGLGLSIAKWIADKHSGYFELLSYENIGTRISLVLPFDPEGSSNVEIKDER